MKVGKLFAVNFSFCMYATIGKDYGISWCHLRCVCIQRSRKKEQLSLGNDAGILVSRNRCWQHRMSWTIESWWSSFLVSEFASSLTWHEYLPLITKPRDDVLFAFPNMKQIAIHTLHSSSPSAFWTKEPQTQPLHVGLIAHLLLSIVVQSTALNTRRFSVKLKWRWTSAWRADSEWIPPAFSSNSFKKKRKKKCLSCKWSLGSSTCLDVTNHSDCVTCVQLSQVLLLVKFFRLYI